LDQSVGKGKKNKNKIGKGVWRKEAGYPSIISVELSLKTTRCDYKVNMASMEKRKIRTGKKLKSLKLLMFQIKVTIVCNNVSLPSLPSEARVWVGRTTLNREK